MAYIKGIVDGDGYVDRSNQNRLKHGIGKPRIRLNVTSKCFTDSFISTLKTFNLVPRMNERQTHSDFNGYSWKSLMYDVRVTCDEDFIQKLQSFTFQNQDEAISYLIGLFQAEGCFRVQKYSDRECWMWHITNKDVVKLNNIQNILQTLKIKSRIILMKNDIFRLYIQRRADIEKLRDLGVRKLGG